MSILSRGWKNRKRQWREKGVTNWLHSETGNWIYFEWQTLFERVHTHTRTYTHARTRTHIHPHSHKHTRTHAHARARTHTHKHTRTLTLTHTLTHTHTHTHTRTQFVSFISFLRIVADSLRNGCEEVSFDNLSVECVTEKWIQLIIFESLLTSFKTSVVFKGNLAGSKISLSH